MLKDPAYVEKLHQAHLRNQRGEFESYECQKHNTFKEGFFPTKDGFRSNYQKDLEVKFPKENPYLNKQKSPHLTAYLNLKK